MAYRRRRGETGSSKAENRREGRRKPAKNEMIRMKRRIIEMMAVRATPRCTLRAASHRVWRRVAPAFCAQAATTVLAQRIRCAAAYRARAILRSAPLATSLRVRNTHAATSALPLYCAPRQLNTCRVRISIIRSAASLFTHHGSVTLALKSSIGIAPHSVGNLAKAVNGGKPSSEMACRKI